MLTEALILAATGIAFVFLFLGLLVFAVRGMSSVSFLLYKAEVQGHASHGSNEKQKKAAIVAACTHHHAVNSAARKRK